MGEDLAKWKPTWRIMYAGYREGDKSDEPTMAGRVVIHSAGQERIGGFYIHRSGSVKIWYKDGYEKKTIYAPIQLCTFTKRHEGNVNIYDVVVDKNKLEVIYGKSDNQNGVKMNENSKELPEYTSPKESAGFWARVFKTRDPEYWKETFQKELDIRWKIFDTKLESFSSEWKNFKKTHMEIAEEAENVGFYEEEWKESLTSLGNLIDKNTTHEKQMWDTTQRNKNMKGLKIKQKFKDSDVDEIRFNNMMEYIKQYPELQTERPIDKALEAAKEKRDEVISAKKMVSGKEKEANTYLNTAKSDLQRIEHQLDSFETIKTEGEKKIKEEQGKLSFKIRSVLMTAAEKESLNLFIFECDRKVDECRDQLKLMKEDLKDYEKREFKPIVTKKFSPIED